MRGEPANINRYIDGMFTGMSTAYRPPAADLRDADGAGGDV